MKKILSSIFLFVWLFIGFCSASPVSAHGEEPRLEISAEKLNPGAPLDLRGVDFEPETEIFLTLIGPQTEIPLGKTRADAEGGFLFTFTLPARLTEGEYKVRAKTDDHDLQSPSFIVWGSGFYNAGAELSRDNADGLLVPMPTIPSPNARVSSPVPVPVTSPTATLSVPGKAYIFFILAAVGLISVVFLLIRRR